MNQKYFKSFKNQFTFIVLCYSTLKRNYLFTEQVTVLDNFLDNFI